MSRHAPAASPTNDARALRWLKDQHEAPCGAADCDSVYCYIAKRLEAVPTPTRGERNPENLRNTEVGGAGAVNERDEQSASSRTPSNSLALRSGNTGYDPTGDRQAAAARGTRMNNRTKTWSLRLNHL